MSLLDELAIEFGLGRYDLGHLIATAPRRYKSYEIPKRHGGFRVIAQPSRELKSLQRYILKSKLESIPIHDSAKAYVKGTGIRDNATPHLGARAILKLDFSNFFPSIKPSDFRKFVSENRPDSIALEDLPAYERLLFWGDGRPTPQSLSIGAPTSPTISNILMRKIDTTLYDEALSMGVKYTRYADDITASSDSVATLLNFEKICRSVIAKSRSPKLSFNEDKRGIFLKGRKQMVTGLILTPEGKVSVGRNRKREISALLHRATLGDLSAEQMSHLKGLLGFCLACEPQFVNGMRAKYGDVTLDRILRYVVPPRATRRQAVR